MLITPLSSLTSGVKPWLSRARASTSLVSWGPGLSAAQWSREQVSLVRPNAAERWSRVVVTAAPSPETEEMSPGPPGREQSWPHMVTSWSSNSVKFS